MRKTIFVFIFWVLLPAYATAKLNPFIGWWELKEDPSIKFYVSEKIKEDTYELSFHEKDKNQTVELVLHNGCLFHARDKENGAKEFEICPGQDGVGLILNNRDKKGTFLPTNDPFLGHWLFEGNKNVQVNIKYLDFTYWFEVLEHAQLQTFKVVLRDGCLFHVKDKERNLPEFEICLGKSSESLIVDYGFMASTLERMQEK